MANDPEAIAREVAADVLVVYATPVRGGNITRARIDGDGAGGFVKLPDASSLQFDVTDKLNGISNILILHGDADTVVPFDDAREIYRHCGEPKRLIPLEQGDHPMSRKDHQDLFAREAAQWFATGLPR